VKETDWLRLAVAEPVAVHVIVQSAWGRTTVSGNAKHMLIASTISESGPAGVLLVIIQRKDAKTQRRKVSPRPLRLCVLAPLRLCVESSKADLHDIRDLSVNSQDQPDKAATCEASWNSTRVNLIESKEAGSGARE
jgi:hypothetical protein